MGLPATCLMRQLTFDPPTPKNHCPSSLQPSLSSSSFIIRWSSLHMKASWQPFSSPLQVFGDNWLKQDIYWSVAQWYKTIGNLCWEVWSLKNIISAWHCTSKDRINDKFNQWKERKKGEKNVKIHFRSQDCDCQWEGDSYQVKYYLILIIVHGDAGSDNDIF